jgi:hypothetical protein
VAANIVAGEAVLKPPHLADMLQFTSVADHVGRISQFKSVAAGVGRLRQFNGPPILGEAQELRYRQIRLFGWPPSDLLRLDLLLANAGSDDERAYLKKAVAAGNSIEDVTWLAGQIRGKDRFWLHGNLRLVDDSRNGGKGLIQQWSNSCVPTAAEVIRGEIDPVYALRTRQANYDITAAGPNKALADEQTNMLGMVDAIPTPSGQPAGTGMNSEFGINYLSFPQAGVGYGKVAVNGSPNPRAFDALDRTLASGLPAALSIGDSTGSKHAVVVTGSFGTGADKTYAIHDPGNGKSVYVKASDLRSGNVVPAIAGWSVIFSAYVNGY